QPARLPTGPGAQARKPQPGSGRLLGVRIDIVACFVFLQDSSKSASVIRRPREVPSSLGRPVSGGRSHVGIFLAVSDFSGGSAVSEGPLAPPAGFRARPGPAP